VLIKVEANHEGVFYYKEIPMEDVPRELNSDNMPFTIGIKTEWQMKKMLKHGHKGGEAIDATFGTNHIKISRYHVSVIYREHTCRVEKLSEKNP
jgi:hypothetical protein